MSLPLHRYSTSDWMETDSVWCYFGSFKVNYVILVLIFIWTSFSYEFYGTKKHVDIIIKINLEFYGIPEN